MNDRLAIFLSPSKSQPPTGFQSEKSHYRALYQQFKKDRRARRVQWCLGLLRRKQKNGPEGPF